MDYFAVIYGKRGQGKSSLLKRLQLGLKTPSVIVDPLHEHHARDIDRVFRPFGDVWEAVVEAANVAYRLGKQVNPDSEARPESAVTLIIDEVDAAVKHYGLGGIPKALDQLARYGRHWGVNMILAARRPVDIPISLASQATDLFSFKQDSPRDLEYFKKLGIAPELFEGLPTHYFVHKGPHDVAHKHAGPWTVCREGVLRDE